MPGSGTRHLGYGSSGAIDRGGCREAVLEREMRLDSLVNNVRIMAAPFAMTEDGYEAQ
jgi:hypothetical protein